jgi:5'-nucleotidase
VSIIRHSIITSTLIAAIFTGCGSTSDNNSAKELEVSIFHVNDTHSHLDSETYSLKFNDVTTYTEIGGYPRVVTKIKALQDAHDNTLTLNAGDTFQGTLYYSLFKGKADSDMLNMISWDAFELGNHEFDDGDEALKTFLDDTINMPVIAANVVPMSGNILENIWTPYVIKEYANGEKVGVIGIDTKQKTEESSSPSDQIRFLDEVETAQKYIDELTNQGINKIVLLTHQGYSSDKEMAAQLDGVDVIIGGDSHTLLGDFSTVGLSYSNGYDYPTKTVDASGKPVCIAQAWQYAYAVGHLNVYFDKAGDVSSCAGDSVLLIGDSFKQDDETGAKVDVSADVKAEILATISAHSNLEQVEKDSVTEATLSTYRSQVDAQKNVVIGTSSELIGHSRIPGDNYDKLTTLPLGSDIAPIVAKSFYDLSKRADACIQNAGGVRTPVLAGDVTMGTAYTLLPFANTLFEIDMKGSEIKQVLEDALNNYIDNGGSTGSFPYAYGLRFDIDTTQTTNNRISNLEIKDRTTGTWSTIDNTTMYVIVTNSYTGGGKDGYVTFKTVQDERGPGIDTYLDYALSFVRYVENLTKEGKALEKLPSTEHCIKSFK